jgi:hypothetical protein
LTIRAALSSVSATLPAERHGAEHRSGADLRRGELRLHRLDRPLLAASGNRDLLAGAFLIAFASPDQDPQTVRQLGQIGDLERAEAGVYRVQGTLARQSAAGTTPSVVSERLAADFALALHPVTDTLLPSVGTHDICNAMSRIGGRRG